MELGIEQILIIIGVLMMLVFLLSYVADKTGKTSRDIVVSAVLPVPLLQYTRKYRKGISETLLATMVSVGLILFVALIIIKFWPSLTGAGSELTVQKIGDTIGGWFT